MKVIKYWQVRLIRLTQPSSIINECKHIETLVFEGYSKDKPNIKLGTGLSIELFTAPDSLETRIIRDHAIDSVRCIPIYAEEIDGIAYEENPGDDAKAPSREAMIEYIKRAIGEGYHPITCNELIGNSDLLWFLHGEAIDYEYRSCWRWYNDGHGFHETFEKTKPGRNSLKALSFEEAVKPVIKWLNENANPHASVIVDVTNATLFIGEIGFRTEEFIKD
ncbi:hypothetical protein [Raoultella ornithinolytica]|uniref:hypothetical protein n=1 Tax=Raoultella ornithinolytica TaxID=54291 RepID=UPI002350C0D9|nr:hypothetical protein [Raoultella ornithinolytica]MDC7941357.1 hypothetical protein [Raoultella ornithinolytica]